MTHNSFWNDAARNGAIIGGIGALGALLSDATSVGLFNFIGFGCYVWLLIRFARQRAEALSTPEQEYGYGHRLGFIVAMSLFTGIIKGAYMILASLILFAEKYSSAYDQTLALLQQTGLYTSEMLASLNEALRSPLMIAGSSIIGQIFIGLLFGVVLAAIAQPRPGFTLSDDDASKQQ